MPTVIGANNALAVKRYSATLMTDANKQSFFGSKFIGVGETALKPIQILTDLESDAGDKVSFDLVMNLKERPAEGDERIEGKGEKLVFYTSQVNIDMIRKNVDTGTKMTKKRTVHNLRDVARRRLSNYFAKLFDHLLFMYLSGARGVNRRIPFPTSFSGISGNPLQPPDTDHYIIAGGKTKATLASSDKFTLADIDKCVSYADMMGEDSSASATDMVPVDIDGTEGYICIMNPNQARDLRTASGTETWLDIQKALATTLGNKSPIVNGSMGMHNGVVLHKHKDVIRFDDYGAAGNIPAARALFLASQAAVIAYGNPGGTDKMRFKWHEELTDHENSMEVSASACLGITKTTFNGIDFGIMAIDTAAAKAA